MAIRVVRLGAARLLEEGVRLGTVRHPPRGIPKQNHAILDYFDVWLPDLAPSAALFAWARLKPLTPHRWRAFRKRYRAEMAKPVARRLISLLAVLSLRTNLSVGCYCADETRCHRTLLRELLVEAGAKLV